MSVLLLDDESSEDDCCIVDSQRNQANVNNTHCIDIIGENDNNNNNAYDRSGKIARVERTAHSNSTISQTSKIQTFPCIGQKQENNNKSNNDRHHEFDTVMSKMRNVMRTPSTAPAKVNNVKGTTEQLEEEEECESCEEQIKTNINTDKKLFTPRAKTTECWKASKSHTQQRQEQMTHKEHKEEELKEVESLSSLHPSSASWSRSQLEKLKSGGGDGLSKMDAFVFGAPRIGIQEYKSATSLVEFKENTISDVDNDIAKEHSDNVDIVLLDDNIDEHQSQVVNPDINSVPSEHSPNTVTVANHANNDNNSTKLSNTQTAVNCELSPRSTLESTISPLQQTSTQESCIISPVPSPSPSLHSTSTSHSDKQMNLTDFFTRLSGSKKEK